MLRLTHLGHACLLVETGGARLLLDPGVLSAFDDIRDLDAVLVTHQHPDHVNTARLSPLRCSGSAYTPPGQVHAVSTARRRTRPRTQMYRTSRWLKRRIPAIPSNEEA